MKYTNFVAALVPVCILLAGCPWLAPRSFQFTSADISQGGFRAFEDEIPEGEPTDDALDGDGEERELVEPDIYRRVGNLLFVLNQYRGLVIVDLDAMEVAGRLPVSGFPRDLYLVGDTAYVLVSHATSFEEDGGTLKAKMASVLHAVDLTDTSNPSVLASFDLAGDVVDSRLVGDILYTVTSEYSYFYADAEVVGDGTTTGATHVVSVDVSNPSAPTQVDNLRFVGTGHVVQATQQNIFVATNSYVSNETEIAVVDIDDPDGDVSVAGTVMVPGYVADRFKMDAWNGTLRVVSSTWRFEGQEVFVSAFDLATLDPYPLFRLEEAAGESLFATRFDGPLAYIVTYFVVDPLFVVDLSDPANPTVREPLVIPGFSIHIEPFGDRLVALGVDDSNGTRRVGVSLYDVSGDPQRIAHVSFGEEWSWSNAFSDVKAFTVLDDLIVVPFSGWAEGVGGFDRLQFITYTRDSLRLRGTVDMHGTVQRTFEYDPHLYSITSERIVRLDASDPDAPGVESELTLAENVIDFAEIDGGTGVKIVFQYDTGITELRTVNGALEDIDSLRVDVGYYDAIVVHDRNVAVAGTEYGDRGAHYVVAVASVDDDGNLSLVQRTVVNVDPFYRFFGGPYPIEPLPLDDTRIGIAPDIIPPFDRSERTFKLENYWALRGYSQDVDRTMGDDEVVQVLALVDLDSGKWEETVGLGFDDVMSLNGVGNKLYLGSKVLMDTFLERPLCAFFIRELDVLGGAVGPNANVPGTFLQYDPASDVLALQDFQWTDVFDYATSIATVEWDGGERATLLDRLDLRQFSYQIVPAGSRFYHPAYVDGFAVRSVLLGRDGALSRGPSQLVTDSWGNLIGAMGRNVYVNAFGAALAHYDFGDKDVSLEQVVPVSGYPMRVVFGKNRVYVPLGFGGLIALER